MKTYAFKGECEIDKLYQKIPYVYNILIIKFLSTH